MRRLWTDLADGLRKRGPDRAVDPAGWQSHADLVAHFLTQCLFCFFAEDVGLLPNKMFEGLVNNKSLTSDKLTTGLTNLFTVMRKGGLYGNDDIPWFNGGLFKRVNVPELSIMEVTELRNAAALNWSAIDVSIFGTLFERGLDPSKRSQLGAHYTDPATILRIVEPVLSRPLLQKWELIAQEVRGLLAKSAKKGDRNYKSAQAKFVLWLEHLKDYRVLDPACGSGNFLFLGLKALKDIEHKSHLDAAAMGLDRQADLVTGPHNVLGIELNEYAAELARVTVWIGELQWRIEHGYDFKTNPVLEPLDHFECRDALLSFIPAGSEGVVADSGAPSSDSGARAGQTPRSDNVVEAQWPKASVVIGNPPFLGDKRMRSELGADYTTTLRKVYEGRVPGGADLVCYWFEKARTAIETNGLGAAGLVATNSIRGGKNRKVLDAICDRTRIYEAWSDEGWVNEGAAVRVSLVAFGHATQDAKLDGHNALSIHADLSSGRGDVHIADLTTSRNIPGNARTAFVGIQKTGPFEISGELARDWLRQPNPNGQPNSIVVRPWSNGLDITRRNRDMWIVDYGADMAAVEASLFEKPFEYLTKHVKPMRVGKREARTNECYWLFQWSRPVMRDAIAGLPRIIVTPEVAKHRNFAWLPATTVADKNLSVVARADDTTFGILHSRFHELWSLRLGTSLENRPRYTPTTCFETFPFPAGLTPADTAHQRTEALEGGAVIPAGLSESNRPLAPVKYAQSATKIVASTMPLPSLRPRPDREGRWAAEGSAQVKEEPAQRAGDTEQNPLPSNHPERATTSPGARHNAVTIATAAKRLNDLRDNWLNPKEWTDRVPEVIPLGMTTSPYPERILPKPGHEKELAERTLTKLYNQRPAWLDAAHKALDTAVAQAYGWSDYTADMPDEEILKRLLVLNLERSGCAK